MSGAVALALCEATRELLKGDARIRLQEQPFQILEMLLERRGALVTRDELRARLWPDGTFVDFEHSLNAAIKRLRAALGDDAKAPRYIQTLPRRGYRWIAVPVAPSVYDDCIKIVWA
jgi:DNA-binding winged helix-turn-helix (wHTH) protein